MTITVDLVLSCGCRRDAVTDAPLDLCDEHKAPATAQDSPPVPSVMPARLAQEAFAFSGPFDTTLPPKRKRR
jgi:hypothetical protein